MNGVVFSRLFKWAHLHRRCCHNFFWGCVCVWGGGLRYKYVNACLPPFTARARVHWVWWSTQLCCGRGLNGGESQGREEEGEGGIKKMEEKEGGGAWGGGVYIINYDFITCSQFLGDLLFRGALMNNKRRGQRERKRKGSDWWSECRHRHQLARSSTAPQTGMPERYGFIKIATEGNNL